MTDIVGSQRRSELMARICNRDTTPELAVRRIAYRIGLRFRLHRKDLHGRPDLVFSKHRLAVFVHACFWHRHEGCRYASTPKYRTAFSLLNEKFAVSVERDARQEVALRTLGWRTLVIWQCETRTETVVERKLADLIECDRATLERRSALSSATTVEYGSTAQGTEVSIHLYSLRDRVEYGSSTAGTAALGFDERT